MRRCAFQTLWFQSAAHRTPKFGYHKEAIDNSNYLMTKRLGELDAHLMGNAITIQGKSVCFQIDSMNRQGRILLNTDEIEEVPFCSLTTALGGLSLCRSAIVLVAIEAMWIGVRVSNAGDRVESSSGYTHQCKEGDKIRRLTRQKRLCAEFCLKRNPKIPSEMHRRALKMPWWQSATHSTQKSV